MSEQNEQGIPEKELTTYAKEQEHLRSVRQELRESVQDSPVSISRMNILGISTLADISGILVERFPDMRYFTFSVDWMDNDVPVLSAGSIWPHEGSVLNEGTAEAAATLLCELADDDDTVRMIAPFAGIMDAVQLSEWKPSDGISQGLEIIDDYAYKPVKRR